MFDRRRRFYFLSGLGFRRLGLRALATCCGMSARMSSVVCVPGESFEAEFQVGLGLDLVGLGGFHEGVGHGAGVGPGSALAKSQFLRLNPIAGHTLPAVLSHMPETSWCKGRP